MMDSKAWGIIGRGWLATKLVDRLSFAGINHWSTRRDTFDLLRDTFPSTACDVLFLNTPPLVNISPSDYVDKIFLNDSAKIIFISSTSVYGVAGGVYNESSATYPQTANAKWLVQVEEKLRLKFASQLTVIRPGGLIGGQRHPVYSLSGKQIETDGNEPVNLIHRDDLVEMILTVAKEDNIALINAVAPYHPAKNEYYNAWAARLNLLPVKFGEAQAARREIHSEIVETLYTKWICPNLDFL